MGMRSSDIAKRFMKLEVPGLACAFTFMLVWHLNISSFAHAADDVTINIRGKISPRCEISNLAAAVELGSLNEHGELAVPFRLYCNDPFMYRFSSAYGRLKHSNSSGHERSGFSSSIAYSIALSLPTDDGLISNTCLSTEIMPGSQVCGNGASRASAMVDANATLTFRWHPDPHIIAGTYSDVFKLTIEPDL